MEGAVGGVLFAFAGPAREVVAARAGAADHQAQGGAAAQAPGVADLGPGTGEQRGGLRGALAQPGQLYGAARQLDASGAGCGCHVHLPSAEKGRTVG